jgi:heme exporter protein B
MGGFVAVLSKDLRLELRSGESTIALVAMSLLILVVMVFALDPAGGARDAGTAAGALWLALVFAGMVGATRALLAERDNGCMRALFLSPLDRGALYLAKLFAAFIFMAIAEAAAIVVMVLFFNLDFDARLLRLLPVIGLGALGFSALSTLLAAISGRLRAGDLLLPLLAIPLFVPALIAGVKASGAALSGAPMEAMAQWLKILVAFDIIFLTAGYLLFEQVVGED